MRKWLKYTIVLSIVVLFAIAGYFFGYRPLLEEESEALAKEYIEAYREMEEKALKEADELFAELSEDSLDWRIDRYWFEINLQKLLEEHDYIDLEPKVAAFRERYRDELSAAKYAQAVTYVETGTGTKEQVDALLETITGDFQGTEAAGKLEEFREKYAEKIAALPAGEEGTPDPIEEYRFEKFSQVMKERNSVFTDDLEFWYGFFTNKQRLRMYIDMLEEGDSEKIVLGLSGEYTDIETEKAGKKFKSFLPRSDECVYVLITAKDGVITGFYTEYAE